MSVCIILPVPHVARQGKIQNECFTAVNNIFIISIDNIIIIIIIIIRIIIPHLIQKELAKA